MELKISAKVYLTTLIVLLFIYPIYAINFNDILGYKMWLSIMTVLVFIALIVLFVCQYDPFKE